MRTMLAVLGIGLVITTATILASAGHGGPGRHGMHGEGPHGEGPFAALDLTDAQKEQIKALHEQFREAHAAELEQMKALHEQMRTQMENGDREAAKETRGKIHDLKESLHADHRALFEQAKSILTDEQRAKLEEMHANGDCRGKGKRKHHRGENAEGSSESTDPGLE